MAADDSPQKQLRAVKALIGWLEPEEAQLILAGRDYDSLSRPEHVVRAERARRAVASRPPFGSPEAVESPITGDLHGHMGRLQESAIGAAFFRAGGRAAMVDLRKVCAYQPTVSIEHSDTRLATVDPENVVTVGEISLPIPKPQNVAAEFDRKQQAWMIPAYSPDLRVVEPFDSQPEPGVLAFGFKIRVASPLMQVASCNGRYFLNDGYHRAYGFLRRGINVVPTLVRDFASLEEFFGRSAQGARLPLEKLIGERPAFLPDYLADDVAATAMVPPADKMIVIAALQLQPSGR